MKTVLSASLLAVSAAMIAGCHGGESASHRRPYKPCRRGWLRAGSNRLPLNVSSTGTVHARETAVVSAQVMGRIQQVLVHEGDSVRAGQTLVVLDDAALRARWSRPRQA